MKVKRIESQVALLATVVVILLGELLLIQGQYLSGVLLYSFIMLILLLYGAYRWEHPQRHLVILTIPSIIRLLNFTLPFGGISPPFAQVLVSLPLVPVGMVFIWLFKDDAPSFSFDWHKMSAYLLFAGLGGLVGFILFQLKNPERLIWNTPLLLMFYIFVFVFAMGFLEEWLFHGIMQNVLANLTGRSIAVLIVGVVYTILNINQNSWMFILVVFLFMCGLGWLQTTSKNLLLVCLAHGAANIMFFIILPWI